MYLVSSCLAGVNCRYNGSNSENKVIKEWVKEGKAIAICPELIAGLPTPRPCCEIVINKSGNKKIAAKEGQDFTKEFIEGAEKALEIAKIIGIKKAILQSKSPTCGYGIIYDGTFSGKLKEGNGLAAELFIKNGIEVYTENDLDKL
ncbi:DUF523 domain-containing protein [Anaeromicrobium sediminis]|uniref:Purine-nucleoside phosphorylase n=1 Tax=Anaeromicrobium sediminis TaxID=1478221 RepID=A0A267MNE6_9FIRM|nr:DUF523 domain-containing protein [Anaeromicrobium sediminis]PAB60353.1 purine-nucleoside phosphorylase [Anaeromicrobium sediminis]